MLGFDLKMISFVVMQGNHECSATPTFVSGLGFQFINTVSQCLHDSQESMIRNLVAIAEKRLEQYELELLGRVDRDENM